MNNNICHLIFVLGIIAIILVSGCIQQTRQEVTSVPETTQTQQEVMTKAMIFEVIIPENTPEEDTVWVYVRQKPYKMEKISDLTYSIALNEARLFGEGYIPGPNEKLR